MKNQCTLTEPPVRRTNGTLVTVKTKPVVETSPWPLLNLARWVRSWVSAHNSVIPIHFYLPR